MDESYRRKDTKREWLMKSIFERKCCTVKSLMKIRNEIVGVSNRLRAKGKNCQPVKENSRGNGIWNRIMEINTELWVRTPKKTE